MVTLDQTRIDSSLYSVALEVSSKKYLREEQKNRIHNIFPQELPAFSNKWVFTLLASTTSTGYEVHNLIKHCMKKQYKYKKFKISSQR